MSQTQVRKPCPGCRALIPAGTPRCPRCTQADNQRRAAKSKHHGLTTRAWQIKRRAILTMNPRCQRCHRAPSTTVHLDPAWHGNHIEAPLEALTALCASCHGTIDAPRSKGRGIAL